MYLKATFKVLHILTVVLEEGLAMSCCFTILPIVLIVSITSGPTHICATRVEIQEISNDVKQIFKTTLLPGIQGAVNRLQNNGVDEILKVDATPDVEMYRAVTDDLPAKQYLLVRLKMTLRIGGASRYAWFGVELSDNIPSGQQSQLAAFAKKIFGIRLSNVLEVSARKDPSKNELPTTKGVKLEAPESGAEVMDLIGIDLKKLLLESLGVAINWPREFLKLVKDNDPTGMADKVCVKELCTPILDAIWESETIGDICALTVETVKGMCCLILGSSN